MIVIKCCLLSSPDLCTDIKEFFSNSNIVLYTVDLENLEWLITSEILHLGNFATVEHIVQKIFFSVSLYSVIFNSFSYNLSLSIESAISAIYSFFVILLSTSCSFGNITKETVPLRYYLKTKDNEKKEIKKEHKYYIGNIYKNYLIFYL